MHNVSPNSQIEQSSSYCQAVITACGKEGIFYSLLMNMRQELKRINTVRNKDNWIETYPSGESIRSFDAQELSF